MNNRLWALPFLVDAAYCETTKSDSNVIRANVGRGGTGYMVEYTATALYSSMTTTV